MFRQSSGEKSVIKNDTRDHEVEEILEHNNVRINYKYNSLFRNVSQHKGWPRKRK